MKQECRVRHLQNDIGLELAFQSGPRCVSAIPVLASFICNPLCPLLNQNVTSVVFGFRAFSFFHLRPGPPARPRNAAGPGLRSLGTVAAHLSDARLFVAETKERPPVSGELWSLFANMESDPIPSVIEF